MKEMYWIDVLGNISTTAVFLTVASIAVALVMLYVYIDLDGNKLAKKWVKRSFVSFAICLLISIVTPSTKSLYVIYGVGGTIDYIKSNDAAKQLPDKAIKALDAWLDEYTVTNKSDNNEQK